MQISDLLFLGRLGTKVDEQGWISLRKSDAFQPDFLLIKDVFLVFTDHRVRYVTVDEYREHNSKLYFSIIETEVLDEIKESRNVKLMIDPEDLESEGESHSCIDFSLIFNNKIIGKVVDYFDNGAHIIFVCENGEDEFMIPNVEHYIVEILNEEKKIIVENIEDLLAL